MEIVFRYIFINEIGFRKKNFDLYVYEMEIIGKEYVWGFIY